MSCLLRTQVYPGFSQTHIFPPWSSLFCLVSVLRQRAKSGLSHKPPSREDGSTKCHLSWQGWQVRCDCAGAVLSEPEFPIRHRDEQWIFRTWIEKLFWSILLLDITFILMFYLFFFILLSLPPLLAPWAQPKLHTSTCSLGAWQDWISSFVFPGSNSPHLLERRAKRGWGIESLWRKVFGGRFWIIFTRHKLLTVWTWHVVNEIYFHDDYFYTPTIREPTSTVAHKKKKNKSFQFDTHSVTF